ncbi:MAG: hypothetical protein QOE88_1435 [Verrucomicrobiota bacterium]|nr:hypothetical protein [Verrucomicrobiota bacterium]
MLFYPIGGRTHSVGVTGKLGIPVHSLGSTLRPCHLQLNRGAAHLEINFAVYSRSRHPSRGGAKTARSRVGPGGAWGAHRSSRAGAEAETSRSRAFDRRGGPCANWIWPSEGRSWSTARARRFSKRGLLPRCWKENAARPKITERRWAMIPFGNEQPRRPEEKGPVVFRLYVVDEGPSSARAMANLSAICKTICPITTR